MTFDWNQFRKQPIEAQTQPSAPQASFDWSQFKKSSPPQKYDFEGENDLDRVVIKENDIPIIPEGNKEAPVLKILNKAEYDKNT